MSLQALCGASGDLIPAPPDAGGLSVPNRLMTHSHSPASPGDAHTLLSQPVWCAPWSRSSLLQGYHQEMPRAAGSRPSAWSSATPWGHWVITGSAGHYSASGEGQFSKIKKEPQILESKPLPNQGCVSQKHDLTNVLTPLPKNISDSGNGLGPPSGISLSVC